MEQKAGERKWLVGLILALVITSLIMTIITGIIYFDLGSITSFSQVNQDDFLFKISIASDANYVGSILAMFTLPLLILAMYQRVNIISKIPKVFMITGMLIYLIGIIMTSIDHFTYDFFSNNIGGIYLHNFFTMIIGTILMNIAVIIILYAIIKYWPGQEYPAYLIGNEPPPDAPQGRV